MIENMPPEWGGILMEKNENKKIQECLKQKWVKSDALCGPHYISPPFHTMNENMFCSIYLFSRVKKKNCEKFPNGKKKECKLQWNLEIKVFSPCAPGSSALYTSAEQHPQHWNLGRAISYGLRGLAKWEGDRIISDSNSGSWQEKK